MNGRDSYDFGGTTGKRFGASQALWTAGQRGLRLQRSRHRQHPARARSAFHLRHALLRQQHDPRVSLLPHPLWLRRQRRLPRSTNSTTLYAHGFYSDLKDWGDKWYYSPVSAAITGTAADPVYPKPATKSSEPKFYTSSKRPNASVGTLILGGRTVHNDSLFLYQISASRSYEVDSAGNPKADFSLGWRQRILQLRTLRRRPISTIRTSAIATPPTSRRC